MPWKFLDPSGCTYFNGKPFVYNLPGRNEKWALTEHPEPAVESDGEACGPGGLHLKKSLDSGSAPVNWWPWYARPAGVLLGQDNEKMRLTAVELRRVDRRVFHRCLRPPFNWGMNANLTNADLRDADLRDADLTDANLRGAKWNKYTRWPEGFTPPQD